MTTPMLTKKKGTMAYVKNEIRGAFTVECEGLYFRVEILRVNTKQDIQVGGYFAEVYMLKFPDGFMRSPLGERSDKAFRQQWLYLEDFPPCVNGNPETVEPVVISEIEKFAKAYVAKFDGKSKLSARVKY